MIKKLIPLLLISLLFIGCATTGGSSPAATAEMQKQAILLGIELSAYNLGYYVGKSKTDADDLAIADAYGLARTGTLDPKVVAEAFVKLKIEQPQLAGSLGIVLKRMGATFDPVSGGLVSLSGIPLEYWDVSASGYASGYEIGKMGQKGISKSAVVKKMPYVPAK